MIQALNTLGFKVKGVKTKEINNDILREKISLPCIAHVIVNDSLLHYVVIHKITKKTYNYCGPCRRGNEDKN